MQRHVGGTTIQFATPLRGHTNATSEKVHQERQALGGLRNLARSVRRVMGMWEIGATMRGSLEAYLRAGPKLMASCISVLGIVADSIADGCVAADLRILFYKAVGADEASCLYNPQIPTPANHHLLEAWRWFKSGALAGLSLSIDTCGVFPACGDDVSEDVFTEVTDAENFINYSGVGKSN